MDNNIYFYLPGIAGMFDVNFILIKRMMEHPDHFYDNVKIGGIFGTIPGARWNGGRMEMGWVADEDIMKIKEFHDYMKIPVRWTWTNPTLKEEDLEDDYCNRLTAGFENGINEVLVTNDLMENHIRNHYPQYPIISSTTKRITDIDMLNQELDKDYKLVVLDYDFNNNWDLLDQINKPEKCEILINPLCNPKCPYRKDHYAAIGRGQKGEPMKFNPKVDGCPAQNRLMHEIMKLPTFITREDLWDKYIPKGFRHFKIEGRNICPAKPIEWYLYYMVKPEYQHEERAWLQLGMETFILNPNIKIYSTKPNAS